MRKEIARHGAVSITVNDRATEDYEHHLAGATFGSGGLRYQRINVREQLENLEPGFFFESRIGDEVVATFALTPRKLEFEEQWIDSFYRSQLCVAERRRRQGIATQLRSAALQWAASHMQGKPFVTWGCVETSNQSAVSLLKESGGLQIGHLKSRLCYRQWPRARDAGARHTESQGRTSPSGMRFADDPQLGHKRVQLKLVDYGSAAKLLYRCLLKFVPPARRRFNPDNFAYVRIQNGTAANVDSQAFDALIHSEMARHKTHYAVIVADPQTLPGAIDLGRFVLTTDLAVIATAHGTDDTLLQRIASKPLNIEPLDL